jgi:4-oxalocrotonate tautomerase family enzyme
MPTIVVDGPRIPSIELKRKMVEGLTDVAAEVYGLDKKIIHVLIRENAPENVGSGGRLIADTHAGRDGR